MAKNGKNKKEQRRSGIKRWQAIVALIIVIAMMVLTLSSLVSMAASSSGENDGEVYERDSSGLTIGQTSVLYDNSIGMPTSEANAIAQTGDGFIYIGSYSGLIRYDGINFERFDSSIGISSVISLYVDSKDRLWIGTNDNGVALMQGNDFKFYGKEDGLRSLSIRSMQEDNEGNILIATTEGLAYVDTELELHDFNDPQVNDEYICELERDDEGYIYGETIDGDFFYLKDLDIEGYYNGNSLGIGTVNCICPDPDKRGWVYLGTDKSDIIHGDLFGGMKNYDIRTYEEQTHINALKFAEGILWLCSDDGIGHIDENGKYTKLSNIEMANSVDGMMEDVEGNLWFVSSRQGVLKITRSIFADVNRTAGLNAFVANTTYVHDGDLYIGTDSGLIILKDTETPVSNDITELFDGIRIRSIKEDADGNLWLCTYSDLGLVKIDKSGNISTWSMDDGLSSNRVRTVCELDDGAMIVSTSGGIHVLRDGQLSEVYDVSSGLSNTEILTICPADAGKVYLGSDGGGLFILEDKRISRLGLDDGLSSEVILRIKADPVREGVYWIITSNSIAYMQDEKITTVTNFPYSNNFDIVFGQGEDMWVLSSGGIYEVNAASMMADENIKYTLYDAECGLPYVTTANSRNYVSEDGELYISGTTGVSKVNIYENIGDDTDARLVIPYIEADDERIFITPDTTSVEIGAHTRRLVIHGYALTYTLSNPTVGYMLTGFDDEEMFTTRRDMAAVTYTNLDGGTYEYRMRTIDTATDETTGEYSITIIKKKALYEHPWFWVAVALVTAFLIIIIVRFYIKKKTMRLEREKMEKQQLVDETINVFAKCIDMKDTYTRGHSFRVAKYTGLLAEKMGYSPEEIHDMKNIALLHDIGKISIPDAILNKEKALDDEEYAIMKTHASNGYEVLKDVTIMPALADGAGYHHERLDGKGYPFGLAGDEIPMVAQLIAVADTFDAMYSTRPYRKKMPLMEVVSEIERVAGTQLNADVVRCLVELANEGLLEDETAV